MSQITTNIGNCSESNCCEISQKKKPTNSIQKYIPIIISFSMLAVGLLMDNAIKNSFFVGVQRVVWYLLAFIPVALPVMRNAIKTIAKRDIFNEFTLMSVATIGAFAIKEYPEAVAVMLFYTVGEIFQDRAVNKAKDNIKRLVDMSPDSATVLREGQYIEASPESVEIGEKIQVRVGEKIPLDGILITDQSSFDTSALTGESRPATYRKGEMVLASMVNLDKVVEVEVRKKYSDSSLVRIMEMVQDATSRKAKTELLIRRFARIYTPLVFALAVAVAFLPALFVSNYVFSEWLYRALVFLVISCPCALVISVPLSYFGGIGAASRNGILFKGANYLDIMSKVNTVVMDKTGTLTKGVFEIQQVVAVGIDSEQLIRTAKAIESQSTHPIAKAISKYREDLTISGMSIKNVSEIAGHGLKGEIDGKVILAGNSRLLHKFGVEYDPKIDNIVSSIVVIAIDGEYSGYITIADELKEDSAALIAGLHKHGVKKAVMLSGDKDAIVQETAAELGIDIAYGGLLPDQKMQHLEQLKSDPSNVIAFVGDGINDTPALALSDVGIAMGAIGSDAAIEVADVVIQTDQPSKILSAIRIGKSTNRIVIQNILFALSVKVVVMTLGAMGIATMWEAVFADVGVTLLAVLNSIRILHKKF